MTNLKPENSVLSKTTKRLHLLHALNEAAASLQRSIRSEEDVLHAFQEQIVNLGLRGGLSLLDGTGQKLIVRATATTSNIQKVIKRFEKMVGMSSQEFEIDINNVETYKRVIQSGDTVFVFNSNEVVAQLLPRKAQKFSKLILDALKTHPGIFVPLRIQGRVQGVLNVVGERLHPDDVSAVVAFANHIAIALENARLISTLQETKETQSLILNSIDEIVYSIKNMPGKPWESQVTFVSEQVKQILGIAPIDFIQNPDLWFSLLHPEDIPLVQAKTEQFITQKKGGSREYRLKNNITGNYIWVEDRINLHFDQQGNIIGQFGVARDTTLRKEAENHIRMQAQLLDSVREAVIATDLGGQIIYWGRGAEHLYGYTNQEMVGQSHAIVLGETFSKNQPIMQRILETGEWSGRITQIRKDRTTLWADSFLSIVKNTTGDPVGLMGIHRDVTEQVLAEEALRESEDRYRKLIELSPDGILVTNLDGRITMVNQRGVVLLGWDTADSLIGKYSSTLVTAEGQQARKERIKIVLEKGFTGIFEQTLLRADGSTFPVEASGSLILDTEGNPQKFITIFRDISERKQSQEELFRLRTAVETSGEAIFLTDRDGVFTYANPEFTKLYGYEASEIINKETPRILKSGIIDAAFYTQLWGGLVNKEVVTGEWINKTKDGRLIEIAGSASPILDSEENLLGFLAIQRDIQERKKAEQELRESETKFRNLAEKSPNAILIIQAGQIVYANEICESITGYTRAELYAPDFTYGTLLPQSAQAQPIGTHHPLLSEQDSPSNECQILTRDGSILDTLHASRTITLAGEPAVLHIITDITPSKIAEREIYHLKDFNERIVQTITEGIVIQDEEGKIIFLNPAAEKLLGYSAEELLGKSWKTFVHSDQYPVVEEADSRRKDGYSDRYELDLLRKDGSRVTVLVSGSPRFENGNFNGMLAVFTDITEQVQAEAALEHLLNAEKEQRRLAETLSIIGLALNISLDLQNLVDLICRECSNLFASSSAFVWLAQDDELIGFAGYGFGRDQFVGHRLKLEDPFSLGPRVIRESLPIYINDAANSDKVNPELVALFQVQAIMGIPLITGQETVGALMILDNRVEKQFTPKDVEIATVLGSNIAVAIQKAQLFEQAQRKNRDLMLLNSIVATATSKPTAETILDTTCRELALAFNISLTSAQLLTQENTTITTIAEYKPENQPTMLGTAIPADQFTAYQYILENRAPLSFVNVQEDPLLSNMQDMLDARGTLSILLLPLTIRGQVIGFINLESQEPRIFQFEEIALAMNAAATAAQVIDNAQLYQELKQHAEKLTALYQTSADITSTLDINSLLHQIAERAVQLTEADRGLILLVDIEAKELKKAVGIAFADEQINDFTYQEICDGLSGWVLREGSPIISKDLMQDPRNTRLALEKAASEPEDERGKSAAIAPLTIKGKMIGTLTVLNSAEKPAFTQEDLELVAMLASQAAITIENARLFADLQQINWELSRLYGASETLLSATIPNLALMAQTIVETVTNEFGQANCSLLLIDNDSKDLIPIAASGIFALEILNHFEVSTNEPSFANQVIHSGEIITIPDLMKSTDYIPQWGDARSLLAIPLKISSRIIGVLEVQSPEPSAFSPSDERLMIAFTEQAALALEHARLFEATQRRRAELEVIVSVSGALRAASNRDEMLPIILDQMAKLLHSRHAGLAIYDSAQQETVLQQGRGVWQSVSTNKEGKHWQVADLVINSGSIYHSNDIQNAAEISQLEPLDDIQAIACVPLLVQEERIGALWLGRNSAISQDEVRLLNAIADIAANAIHRTTLHEQTQRRLDRLFALRNIDMTITSSLDLNQTIKVLLEQTAAQLQVDAANVLILQSENHSLEYAGHIGYRSELWNTASVDPYTSLAGQVVTQRRMIYIPDLQKSQVHIERRWLITTEGFSAYTGTPLIAKGQVKGVLEIFHRKPFKPDSEWIDFLETLAGQAAIAIDNTSLFERMQQAHEELTLAYDTTLEGWSRALELRDMETEGHSQRVTELTLRLAQKIGMKEEELIRVRRGALLHDIGKMAIPDSILRKPGPLTDSEWNIMRQHPVYAYELLAPINYLRPALDIPYCHHEKWDGTGYPRGLQSTEIPLPARIFAVVDVWDALTSDRPYRAAWPKQKAYDYIQSQASKHFDPEVAAIFLNMNGHL